MLRKACDRYFVLSTATFVLIKASVAERKFPCKREALAAICYYQARSNIPHHELSEGAMSLRSPTETKTRKKNHDSPHRILRHSAAIRAP